MIKAVVFDLDGTLSEFNIDYRTVRAEVRSFLIKEGLPASILSTNESIFEMLRKVEVFLRNNDKSASVINKTFKEALAIAERYELEAARRTSLLPGVPEALKSLKEAGLKIGVFTINSKESTNYILKRFRIDKFFNVVVPRDNVKRVKPNSEHLEVALKALGVSSDEAVVVGDGRNDMKCARELNAIAVGMATGFASTEDLIASGANYIITSLVDLSNLIERIDETRSRVQ